MKRISASILLLWTLIGCSNDGGGGGGGGSPSSQPPAPQAIVAIFAATGVVSRGETFTRTIEGRNLGKTSYAAFDVMYDPNVLEYVGASEGGFFAQDGHASTSLQANMVGGVPRSIAVGITRLGQVDGVSGSGTLVTLTFKAIGTGQTALTFKEPKGLRNQSHQPVTVDRWDDGAVTVQ